MLFYDECLFCDPVEYRTQLFVLTIELTAKQLLVNFSYLKPQNVQKVSQKLDWIKNAIFSSAYSCTLRKFSFQSRCCYLEVRGQTFPN